MIMVLVQDLNAPFHEAPAFICVNNDDLTAESSASMASWVVESIRSSVSYALVTPPEPIKGCVGHGIFVLTREVDKAVEVISTLFAKTDP